MEILIGIILVIGSFIGLMNIPPFAELAISLLEKVGFKLGDKYGLKEQIKSPEPKYEDLINRSGITKSLLKPSGIAIVDGERIDVISSDKFIDPKTEIIVDRVEGNRIYVKQK